ncbi:hypothetical protein ABZP36_015645 [Zizania latifolia]
MEVVEQGLLITSKVAGTNGDNVIIPSLSMEEKEHEHANGAAETNDDADTITTVINKTYGDDKTEEPAGIAISTSASSHERRQQAKKRGAFSLFRVVFMSFISGSGSMKKNRDDMDDQKKAYVASHGDTTAPAVVARSSSDVTSWKNLVDAMRPLRLYGQLEYYPPPPPPQLGHDVYHDVLLPPPSLDQRSQGMTSRYSSAQDLQELASGHENENEESAPTTEVDGGDGGTPNAIDMQAKEFIARFYEQFRLQKSDSFSN